MYTQLQVLISYPAKMIALRMVILQELMSYGYGFHCIIIQFASMRTLISSLKCYVLRFMYSKFLSCSYILLVFCDTIIKKKCRLNNWSPKKVNYLRLR